MPAAILAARRLLSALWKKQMQLSEDAQYRNKHQKKCDDLGQHALLQSEPCKCGTILDLGHCVADH